MNLDTSTMTRKGSALLGSLTLSLIALGGAVHADDTEVFYGQVNSSADNRPNLLFVIDTSGSMLSRDEDGDTRMERLERAMHEILDSSQDMNVGLMRFNGGFGGGSVVTPVSFIDEEICSGDGCTEVEVTSQLTREWEDVEENVKSGNISANGNILTMGNGNNDAVGNSGPQDVGLSFSGVDVPQGAKILSATIEFEAHSNSNDNARLEIRAEATDDAAVYNGSRYNVSGRDKTDKINWTPEAWTGNGLYYTPDLADIVQAVTDRAGWCAQNTLNISVRGRSGNKGQRSARSTRSTEEGAPLLRIRYDASEVPATGGCIRQTGKSVIDYYVDDSQELLDNGAVYRNLSDLRIPRYLNGNYSFRTALRFSRLDVPKGAIIEEAYLTLQAKTDSGDDALSVNVAAEDVDDSELFGSDDYSLTTLEKTSTEVTWDLPEVTANDSVTSGNLAGVVQEVVDRDGWTEQSRLSLLITPGSGTGYRAFKSAGNGGAPALTVRYRLNAGPSSPPTTRDVIKHAVSNFQPTGGTPLVGALYEASRYMTGGEVDYGRTRGYNGPYHYRRIPAGENDNPPARTVFSLESQSEGTWTENTADWRSRRFRTSHPDSWTGGTLSDECDGLDPSHPDCKTERVDDEVAGTAATYVSPMTQSCQSSHIILLSDGEPTANGAQRRVENLTGKSCFDSGEPGAQCGTEIADWMKSTDFKSDVSGVQGITTYTVGFDLEGNQFANDFLKGISQSGGGKHFEAKSTRELVKTFEDIIGDFDDGGTSFVSPGATVNQFNRLTHRDDIYFALFAPNKNAQWPGNLKRYRVADVGDDIVIKDVNGLNAVDDESGFFATGAQSFWTRHPDGSNVELGGIANKLELEYGMDDTPRKVMTFTGTMPSETPVDLTADEHRLHEDNELLGHAMLNTSGKADPDAYKSALLKWARGVDVKDADGDGSTDDIRREIGDPMHSQPVILNYGDTPESNKTTVFVSTNQGFLHAIDPEVSSSSNELSTDVEARELYSWIPQELLGNLDFYYENAITRERKYGLDGSMSVWIDDKDRDLTVDTDEKAYLFVGMRRGGNNYYALDVSDRENPKLAWVIKGGPGGTEGFEQLGQSWSRPIPTRIRINNDVKDVLIFTGGYSTDQDPQVNALLERLPRTTDSIGAGLFIVEMETGDLVWAGLGAKDGDKTYGFPGMNYSMPGSAEVIDVDVDGLVDQIYASDTGGQVWRFDITPFHGRSRKHSLDNLIRGGIMAKLGSNIGLADQRRFYYEPDVSLIEKDGQRFVSISIGSGWRAHPLDKTTRDRFYVLRSPHIYSAPAKYGMQVKGTKQWRPITDSDLANADLGLDASVSGPGWYKDLKRTGEKVLSGSLTINNQVAFTTYLPDTGVELCSAAIGGGSVYVLDIVSGQATSDINDDNVVDEDDERRELKHPGLPPPVVAIITENNEGGLVGTEQQDLDFGLLTQRTYWTDLSGTPGESDLEEVTELVESKIEEEEEEEEE